MTSEKYFKKLVISDIWVLIEFEDSTPLILSIPITFGQNNTRIKKHISTPPSPMMG